MWAEIFCDFCRFFWTGAEIVPQLGHIHFLSNPFLFIIIEYFNLILYSVMLLSLNTKYLESPLEQ